jgi:protein-S-isoprenylcysteine O-methyltransferase Ste14
MNMNRASVAAFFISVIALILLLVRHAIFAQGIIGITIQLCAFLIMIWARVRFGRRSFHASAVPTEGGLVTTGPYHFVRHPIYASLLYIVWTAILSNWSLINSGLGLIITLCIAIRILAEEKLVITKYPEYTSYAVHTKRIIPYVI